MKKILILTAALTLITNCVMAQFGLRAGLNIGTLGKDLNNTDPQIGYNAGLIYDINLTGSLYLQPGLFLNMKGGKIEQKTGVAIFGKDFATSEVNTKLNYLEIPIDFKLKVDATVFKFDIFAGPYFSYGLFGKTEVDGSLLSLVTLKDEYNSFKDNGFKNFDWGLQFGAGWYYGEHLYLGVAYDLGLQNISELKEKLNGDKFKGTTGTFIIYAGYSF